MINLFNLTVDRLHHLSHSSIIVAIMSFSVVAAAGDRKLMLLLIVSVATDQYLKYSTARYVSPQL